MMPSLVGTCLARSSAHRVMFIVLAGAAALSGCNAGGPIKIVSAYGPGIEFSGLGPNYAWAPAPDGPQVGAPGMHEFIQRSVEKHLAAKKFVLDDKGTVDFWIDYRVARREKTYAGAVASGETIEEGSLLLEIFDPASRQSIWRGMARARIMDSDPPDVRKQRIENALRSLMDRFPRKK